MSDALATSASKNDQPAGPRKEPVAIRRIVHFQAMVGLGVMLFLASIVAATDLLVRCDAVANWFTRQRLAATVRKNIYFVDIGAYYDQGDMLMLHDLPQADYSRGGVYLMGSSTAENCIDDYHLPHEQRTLIHNFGIGGLNQTQLYQFVRFMDQQQHFLRAGGEKTMVLLGLTFTNAVDRSRGVSDYFPDYMTRSGVYRYDDDGGVTPVPMTDLERFLRIECSRSRSFTLRVWPQGIEPQAMKFDAAAFHMRNVDVMGPDWPPMLDAQLTQMQMLLDYLIQRHVTVVGFFVPEGSWNLTIPARQIFNTRMKAMFAARVLPLFDYSRLVADRDFSDPVHVRPQGTQIIQPKLMSMALDFLHRTKALADPGDEGK